MALYKVIQTRFSNINSGCQLTHLKTTRYSESMCNMEHFRIFTLKYLKKVRNFILLGDKQPAVR